MTLRWLRRLNAVRPRPERRLSLSFEQPCAQHYAVAPIVEFDGEAEHVPTPVWRLDGKVRHGVFIAAVDVSLARVCHGANDLAPLLAHFWVVLEKIFTWIPVALLLIEGCEVVVDVLPDAIAIQYLDDRVVSHRHRDARIVEVAGIHNHWASATLGFETLQRGNEIVDRTGALEQVHVSDAAETAFQSCRQDDDRDFGSRLAKSFGHVGAELSVSEVIVEHSDVDLVDVGFSFFNGTGRNDVVALLLENGGTQKQIFFAIIEQQDPDRLFVADYLAAFQETKFIAIVHLSSK